MICCDRDAVIGKIAKMERNRLRDQLDDPIARVRNGDDTVQLRHVRVPAFACPMNDHSVCHFNPACLKMLFQGAAADFVANLIVSNRNFPALVGCVY